MKIDFSNPETFKKLEKQTYDGILDCEQFPPAEYQYFTELRKVYYAFKFEGLDKLEAETMKKKLYSRYLHYANTHSRYQHAIQDWNANIRKSGTLRSEISQTDNLVEKFRLAVQCIGNMTGDEVFMKTELEKLNNRKWDDTDDFLNK